MPVLVHLSASFSFTLCCVWAVEHGHSTKMLLPGRCPGDASWVGALGGPETLKLLYGQERLTGCVPGGVGMENPERSMIGGGGLTLRKWDFH